MDFIRELNTFEVYHKNSSVTHALPPYENAYRYKYALPMERLSCIRWWTVEVFQRHWYHGITISFVYFFTIKGESFNTERFHWTKLLLIVVELGDTLFIVLRKKRLIFLHYYHHAAVLIYALHSAAEHSNPGRTFVFMNYLAHSCMYTYYALATFGVRLPRWVCSHLFVQRQYDSDQNEISRILGITGR
ncbi:GNS1/SUR4 family protein [Ancylostoma caninum]|uniref:Elongation of very long chain fatty acids protein n=1 Tax=Ancylostoma caninum TaxID=29170 RepID=A0A368FSW0_ANCCA|nr:GNS1/SUR4 family protein [Ancylostoma caninum]